MANSPEYRLTGPCVNCPFRTDKRFPLRYQRAREIATALREGAEFPCHKTTNQTGSGNKAFCGGALVTLEKSDGPNQLMRVAERTGMYDPELLDMDGAGLPTRVASPNA